MNTDALYGNYSVNRKEISYENELQEVAKTGSLTARAVTWFKGENETDFVRTWKAIGAIALAILLAASLVGIPFLIEGIYLWQKHSVNRVANAEDTLSSMDHMEATCDKNYFKFNQSITDAAPKLSESTQETSSEEDDDLYGVSQEKKLKQTNVFIKPASVDTTPETSQEMHYSDSDDDLYGVKQEKNLKDLANKIAKSFTAKSDFHSLTKKVAQLGVGMLIKPKDKPFVFDLSKKGTTFSDEELSVEEEAELKKEQTPPSDDDLYGPNDDDLYGEIKGNANVFLFGEYHEPSKNLYNKSFLKGKAEESLETPAMLSTGWKGHSIGVPMMPQDIESYIPKMLTEDHDEAYTQPDFGKKYANLLKYQELISQIPEQNINNWVLMSTDVIPSSQTLDCSGATNLNELPELPSSLQTLDCSSCQALTSLPGLPKDLQKLDLGGGQGINQMSSFNFAMQKEALKSIQNMPSVSLSDIKSLHEKLSANENWMGKNFNELSLHEKPSVKAQWMGMSATHLSHLEKPLAHKIATDILKQQYTHGPMMEPQDTLTGPNPVLVYDVD